MKEQELQRSARKQEKAFRCNPWKFSKSISDQSSHDSPKFTQDTCLSYFKSCCRTSNQTYNGLLDWVAEVMPCRVIEREFNMDPITPGQVKRTLQRCSSSSSRGVDHITSPPSQEIALHSSFPGYALYKDSLENKQRSTIMVFCKNYFDT